MFYNRKLMNSKTLGKAWRAASHQNIDPEDGTNLPEICVQLDEWVDSDEGDIRKRLSLRTSAVFVDGAAKLYKRGLEQLFEDIAELDKEMSVKRRRHSMDCDTQTDPRIDSSGEVNKSSESEATPEQMLRQPHSSGDLETSGILNRNFGEQSKSPTIEPVQNYLSTRSYNGSSERWTCHGNDSNINNPFVSNDSIELQSERLESSGENRPQIETKDQAVQTSFPYCSHRCEKDGNIDREEFDENLPFGYILIHDNCKSRIPSKIILSSINGDVRNLL